MKLIRCVFQPYKMEELREALENIDIHGMTTYEVKGHGRQKGHTEIYRGAEYHVSFLPKMLIEIAVDDSRVEEVIETICETLRSGQIGDGKIFVSTIDDAVRIRTSERGTDAL